MHKLTTSSILAVKVRSFVIRLTQCHFVSWSHVFLFIQVSCSMWKGTFVSKPALPRWLPVFAKLSFALCRKACFSRLLLFVICNYSIIRWDEFFWFRIKSYEDLFGKCVLITLTVTNLMCKQLRVIVFWLFWDNTGGALTAVCEVIRNFMLVGNLIQLVVLVLHEESRKILRRKGGGSFPIVLLSLFALCGWEVAILLRALLV